VAWSWRGLGCVVRYPTLHSDGVEWTFASEFGRYFDILECLARQWTFSPSTILSSVTVRKCHDDKCRNGLARRKYGIMSLSSYTISCKLRNHLIFPFWSLFCGIHVARSLRPDNSVEEERDLCSNPYPIHLQCCNFPSTTFHSHLRLCGDLGLSVRDLDTQLLRP
jgi:hypothetical protein